MGIRIFAVDFADFSIPQIPKRVLSFCIEEAAALSNTPCIETNMGPQNRIRPRPSASCRMALLKKKRKQALGDAAGDDEAICV